jgi:predicted transcriptional regulator
MGVEMLESLLGSANCERVLIFLAARNEGYAREITRFFETGLGPIQKQLEKLEAGGVLFSRLAGRTRIYAFDPRYPFLQELKRLLEKALSFYPEEQRDELLMNRRRPRRRGKPL